MLGIWGYLLISHDSHRVPQALPQQGTISVAAFRVNPSNGIRFGEALNPGPKKLSLRNQVTVGLCNPTVLQSKEDVFLNLKKAFSCDVLAISETAATSQVQNRFGKAMQRKGIQMLWSPAVAPIKTTISGSEHLRGQAAGVAIMSSLPIRANRNSIPTQWDCNPRIVHSVVQLSGTAVQIIAIYGKTMKLQGAAKYNSDLISFAWDQANMLPIPYFICGDFNMDIEELEIWPFLQSTGHSHLGAIHEMLYASAYPATCMEKTSPDSAIISPSLVSFKVTQVQIAGPEWMATHRPVFFSFTVDDDLRYKKHMILPRQFPTIALEAEDMQWAASQVTLQTEQPLTLEEWGSQVEQVAAQAVVAGKSTLKSQRGLPKAFTGRCKPRKLVRSPVNAAVNKARQGDFELSCEVTSFAGQRQVKQYRRIVSLIAKLVAWERNNRPSAQQLNMDGYH